MDQGLEHLLGTIRRERAREEQKPEGDVISVSETVSMAASAYEGLRNTLEYDEEHLLRRNAIRRILKRSLEEGEPAQIARNVLRELIWARYLPNKRVPERRVDDVAQVLAKYRWLFSRLRTESREGQRHYAWLLDMLSTELEYMLAPPRVDESLASLAYQELKKRVRWNTKRISGEDRDLQLYVAVHRTILKSNQATLRFRVFTLFYPEWTQSSAESDVVAEVAGSLPLVIQSVERQVLHPEADAVYRLVRKHAIVFHVLGDIARDNPEAFEEAVVSRDGERLKGAITKAAKTRYDTFRARLRRLVIRALLFLFLTKMALALLVELPIERLLFHEEDIWPILVNTIFPPVLLGLIGLTVSIPEKKNTAKIIDEVNAILGFGDDFEMLVKLRKPWSRGVAGAVFDVLYAAIFLFTVGAIVSLLAILGFNPISIAFFVFFLSLVLFFGLKIRYSKRDLVIIDSGGSIFGTVFDMLFIPLVRAGRWLSLRAPKVNVFLFFFDFIVEAPFKATIRLVESWIAFVREKKEEI